ncbi:DUF4251 domain-containing protein [Wenyingzhuangia sp. IMCC45467]
MMYKINFFRFIVIGFLSMATIISCSSSKNITTQKQIYKLDSLVNNKQFTIESTWAQPQVTTAMQQVLNSGLMQPGSGAGNINLVGNYNYLTISGDSISSHLPYFGERQMQVNYGGGDGAISFKGVMKNYEVKKNKDHSYRINFSAQSNSETFNVSIKLFPNLQSNMFISSGARFPISYTGSVSANKPKEANK